MISKKPNVIVISLTFLLIAIYLIFVNGGNKNNKINKEIPGAEIKKIEATVEQNIVITTPVKEEIVQSPLILSGRAKVYENTFQYIIKDSNGIKLGEGFVTTGNKDSLGYGNFSTNITYIKPTTANGSIKVFETSEKNGTVLSLNKLNIRFK